jgi:hypothetical protein
MDSRVYDVTETDRAICAPLFEICLKAAADLIDGASGNLSGRLSLHCQAGWSIWPGSLR